MPLTGKDARDFVAKVDAEARQRRADRLAAAKAEALAGGKEPFDLAKLETMCDTSREGQLDPVDVRTQRFEEMYYVQYPSIATLADFARKVEELNRW